MISIEWDMMFYKNEALPNQHPSPSVYYFPFNYYYCDRVLSCAQLNL